MTDESRKTLIDETLDKLANCAEGHGTWGNWREARAVLEAFAEALKPSVPAEDLAWLRETCLGWSFDPYATSKEEEAIQADMERAERLFDRLAGQ